MARSVLITGASSGIGLATLQKFALEGWSITAAVRSESRASELEATLANDGLTARYLCFDLQDRAATDAAMAQLIEVGVPDVLVNNAGVAAFGPLELADDAMIDFAMQTNFAAPVRIIRALLPHFRTRGSGSIVNVSSGLGFAADLGQSIYSASKFALEAASEALYYEMRPFNVRVAVIEPGLTATPIHGKMNAFAGYGPDSPYWEVISERIELLGSSLYRDGWIEDPKTVANAIYEAATAPESPLFVPVGRDTQLSAQLRGRDDLETYEKRGNEALQRLAAPVAA